MVVKNIDNKNKEIKTLKLLLSKSTSESQKKLISKTLRSLENGFKTEKENAYYLNFVFKGKQSSYLLHDIRLVYDGRVAQFDHILISNIGITLLESKSFTGKLTINNDNSLSVDYKNNLKNFPNPVEQNRRHEIVLKDFLKEKIELPTRIKIAGGIKTDHKVLIHPNTIITNKKLPKFFERSDSFASRRDEEINSMGVGKVLSTFVTILTVEKMKEIAKIIIANHQPKYYDYTKKFKVKGVVSIQEEEQCPKCKTGKMIKRKMKQKKYKDNHTSEEFLGCSNFPKCKHTQEL